MKTYVLSLLTLFCFFIENAIAEDSVDPYDLPKVVAVENKAFNPKNDLTANIGVLPLDAFYKALTIGVSYTHSYASYLSWEVINANYASIQDTNLKSDLLNSFAVKPQGILDNVKYYATSNVIYTPIYSKNLIFNERVMHGEFSFLAGAGMVGFASGESAPMFGGGLILRFFKDQSYSHKLDGRLYGHMGKNKSSDLILSLTYGFSFEMSSPTVANSKEENVLE